MTPTNAIFWHDFIDKFMEMLIKTNDKACINISNGNVKEALSLLERMERILEVSYSGCQITTIKPLQIAFGRWFQEI